MLKQRIEPISQFEQIVYDFQLVNGTVHLEMMLHMIRKSSRHKFEVDYSRSYSRLFPRSYGLREEPDIGIEISSWAVKEYQNEIKFKKWGER